MTTQSRSARSSLYTLQANEQQTVTTAGQFIRCVTASADFKLAVDNGSNMFFAQGIGYYAPGAPFKELRLTEVHGAINSIELVIGWGEYADSRFSIAGGLKLDVGDTLTSTLDDNIPAATAQQILAADTTRRRVILTNLPTNPREFRIGGAATAAARGAILMPGDTLILETTAAISAYNPHAAAQSIAILSEHD